LERIAAMISLRVLVTFIVGAGSLAGIEPLAWETGIEGAFFTQFEKVS
jgi:hypothetical protein